MRRWLFILFLLASCVFTSKKETTNTPNTAAENFDSIDSVDTLEAEISGGMRALGLNETSGDPAMSLPNPPDPNEEPKNATDAVAAAEAKEKERGIFKSRSEAKKASRQDQTPHEHTCELVKNICSAATRICQITEKMPNDPEAPKRCERAKGSCERAKKQGEASGCKQ